GGDRDKGKRPQMGKVAEHLADKIFITSDNPRSENPHTIIDDICSGLNLPKQAHIIENRAEAIKTALEQRSPNTIVLVAGKGHETHQEINGQYFDFDDREHIRAHFALSTYSQLDSIQ
ncbi:MAG: UDP-N-acetylmuramoyl-L-alanyl-D-glutamate--2,6-diaminopimelate ligase, partial [Proteobacteria bacterium]|nr:UDP-N-acetylmuramoyl-L-alanyl-D-glutamate--2,6-diaminopimelate ligase [Pseudomonadota bacterium]